jgi:hypothetical protein
MYATGALPQEIMDQVIDHLHADVSSLRACALHQEKWKGY